MEDLANPDMSYYVVAGESSEAIVAALSLVSRPPRKNSDRDFTYFPAEFTFDLSKARLVGQAVAKAIAEDLRAQGYLNVKVKKISRLRRLWMRLKEEICSTKTL